LAAPFLLVPAKESALQRVPPQPSQAARVEKHVLKWRMRMKKTLAVLATVAAIGATTLAVPAPAEARGIGPGLAFGLAAGAVAAGAAGAYGYYGPYGYGPYYGRAYGPGYAYGGPYYGGPNWHRRHWHQYYR
jgi:hypothetical protein